MISASRELFKACKESDLTWTEADEIFEQLAVLFQQEMPVNAQMSYLGLHPFPILERRFHFLRERSEFLMPAVRTALGNRLVLFRLVMLCCHSRLCIQIPNCSISPLVFRCMYKNRSILSRPSPVLLVSIGTQVAFKRN